MALDNLTPVIRPEKILNGDAIEPVTRKEYFMQRGASGGGGGGADGFFPVQLDFESSTADKSSTEIIAAFQSGKMPYAYSDFSGYKQLLQFYGGDSSGAVFIGTTGNPTESDPGLLADITILHMTVLPDKTVQQLIMNRVFS